MDVLSEAVKQLAIEAEKFEELVQKNPQVKGEIKKHIDELDEIIKKLQKDVSPH